MVPCIVSESSEQTPQEMYLRQLIELTDAFQGLNSLQIMTCLDAVKISVFNAEFLSGVTISIDQQFQEGDFKDFMDNLD